MGVVGRDWLAAEVPRKLAGFGGGAGRFDPIRVEAGTAAVPRSVCRAGGPSEGPASASARRGGGRCPNSAKGSVPLSLQPRCILRSW